MVGGDLALFGSPNSIEKLGLELLKPVIEHFVSSGLSLMRILTWILVGHVGNVWSSFKGTRYKKGDELATIQTGNTSFDFPPQLLFIYRRM